VGGGYIAVEFAGIFRGLGAEVHLFYRAPYPLRGFDEECRKVVAENLHRRGVKVYPECTPTGVERGPEGRVTLRYTDRHGSEGRLACGRVMMATGRKANTRGLGLEVRSAHGLQGWGGGGEGGRRGGREGGGRGAVCSVAERKSERQRVRESGRGAV
jgi:glutathione reductase (NADPH)